MAASQASEAYVPDRLAFQIEKLNASNYSTWQKDCEVLLSEKKLWRLYRPEQNLLDRQGQSMHTTTGSGSYERFGLGVGNASCL
jgi:hypothetical protein